jgi:integrase
LEQRRAGWKDKKHPSQWMNTLKAYVFPVMGDKRVDQIETADVLRALSPIWLSKPETARRVRQRVSIILDWAKAAGHRSGDNPVEGVGRGLPRQSEKRGHFAAIPYADVPAFVKKLPDVQSSEFARLV